MFMNAVTEIVFNKKYNENPGKSIMINFRRLLENSKQFETYRENPMYDTIIYKHNTDMFIKGNGQKKYEFYKDQKIKRSKDGMKKIKNLIFELNNLLTHLFVFPC